MKRLTAISIAWALLAAAGCSSSNGPDIGDTDPTSGNGNGGQNPQPAATAALFQPLQGIHFLGHSLGGIVGGHRRSDRRRTLIQRGE
jgi:hypothetical protein